MTGIETLVSLHTQTAYTHGPFEVGKPCYWLYRELDPSGLTSGYKAVGTRFYGLVTKIYRELGCHWYEVEVENMRPTNAPG